MTPKRISLMLAAAPLSSYYSLQDGNFTQPVLDGDPAAIVKPGESVVVRPGDNPVIVEDLPAVVVDNTDKTDELSLAVEAESVRNAVFIADVPVAPVKYQLDYMLDGKAHREKHATIDAAMASVRRLRMLGVTPATSTL